MWHMEQEADTEQPEGQGKSRRRSPRWLRTALLACLAVAIILIAGGGWLLARHAKWPDPQLATTARASSYPIFYPSRLPQGFSRKVQSIQDAGAVFTYALQYDGNRKLFISAIPRPAKASFADFYNRLLSNPTVVPNTDGTAVIGNLDHQLVGMLGTTKSWVTVNAPDGIDADRMHMIVADLKQI